MVMEEKLHLSSQFPKKKRSKSLAIDGKRSSKITNGKRLRTVLCWRIYISTINVLSRFLFARIHLTFDIHGSFRGKPMHCLSLDAERILKECMVYLLCDDQRLSPATRCQNGNMRSFTSMKGTVLSTVNAFLERCSR